MPKPAEALAIASSYPGMKALIRAIDLCGSQELLAQAIGVDPAVISRWLHKSRCVPLEYVPFIVAAVFHEDVSPVTLRPDHLKGWAMLYRQLRRPPRGFVVEESEQAALEGEPQ